MNSASQEILLSRKHLSGFAGLLLLMPFALFAATHLKIPFAVPVLLLLAGGVFFLFRGKSGENSVLRITLPEIFLLFAVSAAVAWLAGQGGYFPQKMDHMARNPILYDLLHSEWPVRYESYYEGNLIYYYNYWLVPAAIGKIFLPLGEKSAVEAAHAALFLWTSLHLTVLLLLLADLLKADTWKKRIGLACLVFLFSGADAAGYLIWCHDLPLLRKMGWSFENWSGFQLSSTFTQLAWVFNQSVPAWLCTALFLNGRDTRRAAVPAVCCLISAPFPAVGLALLGGVFCAGELVRSVRAKDILRFIRDVFSPENVLIALAVVPVMACFYMSNRAVEGETFFLTVRDTRMAVGYLLFLVLEFGLLAALLFRENRRDIVWYAALVQLAVFPAFGIVSYDFGMRATIPALFVLMTAAGRFLLSPKGEEPGFPHRRAAVIALLAIGALTPLMELGESMSRLGSPAPYRNDEIFSFADMYPRHEGMHYVFLGNYVNADSENSFFFRHPARRAKEPADSEDNREVLRLLTGQPAARNLLSDDDAFPLYLCECRNWLFFAASPALLGNLDFYLIRTGDGRADITKVSGLDIRGPIAGRRERTACLAFCRSLCPGFHYLAVGMRGSEAWGPRPLSELLNEAIRTGGNIAMRPGAELVLIRLREHGK